MAKCKTLLGVATADSSRLDDLREELDEIVAKVSDIIEAADDDDRDLDDDELKEVEKLQGKADKIKAQIETRERVTALRSKPNRSSRRRSAPVENDEDAGDEDRATASARRGNPRRQRQSVPATVDQDKGTHGFTSFGEFAMIAHAASLNEGGGDARERMHAAATTYNTEQSGSDGGYLIPPDFRTELWQKVGGDESLMPMCEQFETSRNQMTMPKDETTPWGTAGIQVYWEGEGNAITPSKPIFETDSQRLHKLTAMVNVTDELLDDAVGLNSYLTTRAPVVMRHNINTQIVRGNGVGKPLGILNAASLVTVAKETSQNADTILFENISAMWSRMYAPSRRNAVWLINQDIEPQLDRLAFPVGAATAVPMYMPAGGLSSSPFATLKGRPVMPIEAASTLGDVGDIMLVDLKQYAILQKSGGIRQDVSIHLYFDQDIQSFRFIYRMTGKPLWNAAVTPENSSNTLSWAVALADRA